MKMRFDLRPAELTRKESGKKSFNPMFFLMALLFALFLGGSVFYIATTAVAVLSLGESVSYKQTEVSRLQAGKAALEAEIKRLQEREKVFAETLRIMQDDLPSLEIFEAVDACAPSGLKISELKFTAGESPLVTLNATANTDEQITRFRIELEGSGVFSRVTMPASKLDERTRKVAFTLNMVPLSIGQITTGQITTSASR
jgi:Tfp pilus assembly protein PilN